jgi:hypothetical protein
MTSWKHTLKGLSDAKEYAQNLRSNANGDKSSEQSFHPSFTANKGVTLTLQGGSAGSEGTKDT